MAGSCVRGKRRWVQGAGPGVLVFVCGCLVATSKPATPPHAQGSILAGTRGLLEIAFRGILYHGHAYRKKTFFLCTCAPKAREKKEARACFSFSLPSRDSVYFPGISQSMNGFQRTGRKPGCGAPAASPFFGNAWHAAVLDFHRSAWMSLAVALTRVGAAERAQASYAASAAPFFLQTRTHFRFCTEARPR